jgi:protein TonB
VAGISGFGINPDPVRHIKAEPPPTKILEDVKLEPLPPTPKDEAPPPEAPPVSGPALAANIDLPPLPEVTEVSAVAANVVVAFALPVTGPVRIVKDARFASGAVGGSRTSNGPISVNTGEAYARFLLLPILNYPTVALQRRISGSVEIEFKTTPTGEIYDIKVRSSSGHNELDNAALQNMHRGRWSGEAGYFVKNFVFVLN